MLELRAAHQEMVMVIGPMTIVISPSAWAAVESPLVEMAVARLVAVDPMSSPILGECVNVKLVN